MQLPINFAHRPFRDKYIDEETREMAFWFEFGFNPKTGNVDIADHYGDVIVDVPIKIAMEIILARNQFVSVLNKHLGEKETKE
ncbi:hypothetical protein M0Q28_06110 [Patescibacteria group bacterium]|jgi:hypothetical protein|nr:hypothetical protein [Patescibacteria group bacterium]